MAKKSNGKLWAEFVRNGGTASKRSSTPERVDRRTVDGLVLGVDPSLRGTGIAVVETKGRQATLLHSEVFRFPPSYKTEGCIGEISRRIDRILQDFPIKIAAVEEAIYVQNYRTALTLGAARGSAIAAMVLRGVEIHEYPPLRIKQAVVGYGRASKEQLRKTLCQMVAGMSEKISLDESDATATAVCHWLTSKRPAALR
ncbi:MAG: crossover junction endodeoxyribonuclease RuvC [Puniceicoccales bacterium]